jgi:hypothetical protein
MSKFMILICFVFHFLVQCCRKLIFGGTGKITFNTEISVEICVEFLIKPLI